MRVHAARCDETMRGDFRLALTLTAASRSAMAFCILRTSILRQLQLLTR